MNRSATAVPGLTAKLRSCSTVVVAGVAVTGTLASAGGATAQLAPSVAYASGARVESSATGVSFTIPDGFQAHVDPESQLFVLTGQGMLGGVWAYSEGAPEDLAEVIAEDLEGLGLVLTQDHVVEASATRLSASFHALTDEGMQRLVGSALAGSAGNVFGVVALGPQGSDDRLWSLLEALGRTVTWSAPEARDWRASMGGTLLEARKEGGYLDIDPDDHISTVSESAVSISLCRDGSYEFESTSQLFASTANVSASSEGGDAHSGSWSLVADLVGGAYLVLESLGRGELYYEVDVVDGELVLEDLTFARTPIGC